MTSSQRVISEIPPKGNFGNFLTTYGPREIKNFWHYLGVTVDFVEFPNNQILPRFNFSADFVTVIVPSSSLCFKWLNFMLEVKRKKMLLLLIEVLKTCESYQGSIFLVCFWLKLVISKYLFFSSFRESFFIDRFKIHNCWLKTYGRIPSSFVEVTLFNFFAV